MPSSRVTWRLELPAGWGGRLDPEWLPSGSTESWRRVFAGEDRAGAVFAAGGGGLRWSQLAAVARGLASTLEQYRLQWRVATTGHTGPDVLDSRLLCMLGVATHRMILEYRTLFRAAWTDLDACERSAEHDAEAEGRLAAIPDPAPGGAWRHVLLAAGCVQEVSVHDGRVAAAASVAAARAVDESGVRWAEPVAVARPA